MATLALALNSGRASILPFLPALIGVLPMMGMAGVLLMRLDRKAVTTKDELAEAKDQYKTKLAELEALRDEANRLRSAQMTLSNGKTYRFDTQTMQVVLTDPYVEGAKERLVDVTTYADDGPVLLAVEQAEPRVIRALEGDQVDWGDVKAVANGSTLGQKTTAIEYDWWRNASHGVAQPAPRKAPDPAIGDVKAELERISAELKAIKAARDTTTPTKAMLDRVNALGQAAADVVAVGRMLALPPCPEGIEPAAWAAAHEEVDWVAEHPAEAMAKIMDHRPLYGPPDPVEYAGGMDWCDPERPEPARKRRDIAPLDDKVRALVDKQRAR